MFEELVDQIERNEVDTDYDYNDQYNEEFDYDDLD